MRKPTCLTMRRMFLSAMALCLLLGSGIRGPHFSTTPVALAQAPAKAPARVQDWEPAIRKFEEADKANPPKPGMILFTGSSSFVRWASMSDDLKPLNILNRAFGGSQFTDLNQWVQRDVIAYKPKAVVVYEGDNDLDPHSTKTPREVAAELPKFVKAVRAQLPDTWIYVVSIKPSKLRWDSWSRMQTANKIMQDYVKTQQRTQYIDVATPMFDAQGNLPRDLFVEDGLHPTAKCYAIWTATIKPVLMKRFGPSAKDSE
jgi:lysophospholipase L1-like esterase